MLIFVIFLEIVTKLNQLDLKIGILKNLFFNLCINKPVLNL